MPFTELGQLICGEEVPTFLGVFDFSTASPFLFYSYVPIIIAALIMSLYVFWSDRKSLQARLLLAVTLSFVFWVGNILVQWIASYHTILLFSWQLTAIFEVGIFLSTFYFAYVFFYRKDMPFGWKLVSGLMALSVIAVTPTIFNTTSYDIYNCEGINGVFWQVLYAFEPGAIVLMAAMGIDAYRKVTDKYLKRQIAILSAGIVLFLGVFFLSNFYGEVTRVYEFNLWGPIGMLCFLILLAYMIVRYQTFNVKLFATQALVIGTALLIGARLFYSTTTDGFILSTGTLIAFLISGFFLVKSVRLEIEAKEALKIANEMQADTTSLITHQIRGVFTNTKSGLSNLIEGTYGPVPPAFVSVMDSMFKSQLTGVKTVETFLQAQKIESGTIQYDKKLFDLKAVVEQVSAEEKPRVDSKGLQYEVHIDAGDYMFNGDQVYLTQVIANLIDNAIRYTEKGSITVQLSKKAESVLYSVKDSGIGIPDGDKDKMFTKYGHGKDSRKINADTAGLGLYIVKGIVVGHGGKIWYETEVGKGTTFFVELPISQTSK